MNMAKVRWEGLPSPIRYKGLVSVRADCTPQKNFSKINDAGSDVFYFALKGFIQRYAVHSQQYQLVVSYFLFVFVVFLFVSILCLI